MYIHQFALNIDECSGNQFVNGPFSIEFYTVQNEKIGIQPMTEKPF